MFIDRIMFKKLYGFEENRSHWTLLSTGKLHLEKEFSCERWVDL